MALTREEIWRLTEEACAEYEQLPASTKASLNSRFAQMDADSKERARIIDIRRRRDYYGIID